MIDVAIWKPVAKFPGYEVSALGVVRSITGEIIIPVTGSHGYHRVQLFRKGRPHTRDVHRIVCGAHVAGRHFTNLVVDHINRNRLDNRAVNLRWVTVAENNLNRQHKKRKP